MSIRLNKEAYEELIRGDLEWLDKMIAEHSPNSLEGWHIRDVLQDSIRTHYGDCEDKEKLNVIDYLAVKLQETIGTSPHSFSTIREILLDEKEMILDLIVYWVNTNLRMLHPKNGYETVIFNSGALRNFIDDKLIIGEVENEPSEGSVNAVRSNGI